LESLSPQDPRAIGEFQLRARLGAGGMGQVYLGYSRAGRAVAVKVVHPELASDAHFRRRFAHEVANARAVSGMYTAPVVAAGLDDDPPWFATAFVPGPPLSQVVKRHGPLPEPAVWRLAAGLTEALQAVHAAGLVHRDLKPANVLLADDGPHVIDFGISRALDASTLTASGVIVGTPGYMSPEQAEGEHVDAPSDIFSLGALLAFAATGRAPFGGGSAAAILYRVVSGQADLTGLPDRLREVIASCLAKDPAQRPVPAALGAAISRAEPSGSGSWPTGFWPPETATAIKLSAPELPAPEPWSLPVAVGGNGSGGIGSGGSGPARHGIAQITTEPLGPDLGKTAPPATKAAGPGDLPGGTRVLTEMAAPPPYVPAAPVVPPYHPPAPYSPPAQAPARGTVPSDPVAQSLRGPVPVAARLMQIGALLQVASMIVGLADISALKAVFLAEHPDWSASAVTAFANVATGAVIVTDLLGVIVWLSLARATRRGRRRRAAGTVLFVIFTVMKLSTIGGPGLRAGKIIDVLIWAVALASVIALWAMRRPRPRY
jgi:tRNA A-37 threonylcarbamoyl transferase component Bud32